MESWLFCPVAYFMCLVKSHFNMKLNTRVFEIFSVIMGCVALLGCNQIPPASTENDEPDVTVEEELPVSSVSWSETSLELYVNRSYTLVPIIEPEGASFKNITCSSDNPTVATVKYHGHVTALSAGTAVISLTVDDKSAECVVTVKDLPMATTDYIDEYGVNHGKGVSVGIAVWAPVNCGYMAATSESKGFPHGKLYQWGRKYGQGYDGDAMAPVIEQGPVSIVDGNSESKSGTFYLPASKYGDWTDSKDARRWNSGTENKPVKTEYDPCPNGWRVPTYSELEELKKNWSRWTTNEAGQKGFWLSGLERYSDDVPQVFLYAAGYRNDSGEAVLRGSAGRYWTSTVPDYIDGSASSFLNLTSGLLSLSLSELAAGYSVRCVQE